MASRNYQALFGSPPSIQADVAGMRFATFVEHMIAFVEAHKKK